MSGSVDEKIVELTFKGESFLTGVKGTVSALTDLKNGLNSLKTGADDINQLDQAGKRFSLSGMASGVQAIADKFLNMGTVGITVLSSLVNKAVSAGISLVKSLTIDPIKAGLDVYETKINAIQTILANTSAAGTNLKQVTAALDQLNTYANKTVYNFGQMAQNIGVFTAAGVDLNTSVASIKGIANLAALSGASAEQASTAMYQLSQAIATGSVKLQDWNSVVNAGLGGKVFQNQLEETAKATGVNIDAIIAKAGSFRNSLQSGWLTSKILTQTLETFTGDLSAAQLKAMGFTDQEAQQILKQADAAVKSATQIRTITQLFSALKEEVATAWSQVFEAVIGNINQASFTLSALHNQLENTFTSPIKSLAVFLTKFNEIGGLDLVIQSIVDIFHALGAVLSTVKDAFVQVFPPESADDLAKLVQKFEEFTASLTPSAKTLSELKTVFVGVFSAIKIGIDVISGVVSVIGTLIGVASQGGGGFLDLAAKLASFITKAKDAIESGGALTKFFSGLATVLSLPLKAINAIINSFGGLSGAIDAVIKAISPFVEKVGQEFGKLGEAIAQGIQGGSFQNVANLINQGLLAAIFLKIKSFISSLGKESGGGLLDTIKESFEGLTGALQAMQANLKSGVLEKIAISVALLAASLIALSFVNVANLTKALSAMTIMFTEMITALGVVVKVSGSAGILKMAAIGVALNLLATSMLILSAAVAVLAQFSWEQLAKGIGSIAVLLGLLITATALMSKDTTGLLASAGSMEVMGVALNVLSQAVKRLGELDFATLGKGIGSVAILMGILAAFNTFGGGEKLISTAASLILVGAALLVITQSVKALGALPTDVLVKGLLAIAGALIVISVAMDTFPPDMLATAASLLIVSVALVEMSKALTTLGGMSWSAIAKSMVELFGALTLISAAMIAMTEALPGAAALLVVAAALTILTPVLVTLGNMSWEAIGKGLLALAAAFIIIGAAGLLLTPVVPTLLLLGAAIALIGVGVLAAGIGVAAFAVGLTGLAAAVTASGAAILSFVNSILSLIPLTFQKIGEGIVSFAQAIGNGGAAIENAFVAIFSAVLNGIIKVAPLAGKAFESILDDFLQAVNKDAPKIITAFANFILLVLTNMTKDVPKFISAGTSFIVALLNGISANIGKVVTAAGNLVISFINSIGNNIQKVVNAGVNMVINLVNGIANKIRASSPQMNAAAANLGTAIIQGMVSAVTSGISSVINALVNVASAALNAAKKFLGIASPSKVFAAEVGDQIPEGIAVGVIRSTSVATDSVQAAGKAMLDTLGKTMTTISDTVNANMDLQPKITPVVDLTQAKAGFDQLSNLSKQQLIAASSTSSASSISAANAAAAAAAGLTSSPTSVLNFTQNNTSPVALNNVDIYRRTKNQLSIAKEALT